MGSSGKTPWPSTPIRCSGTCRWIKLASRKSSGAWLRFGTTSQRPPSGCACVSRRFWRNHLDRVLAAPGKIRKVQHHPALPLDQLHGFITDLREREGIAAQALEFLILTATRSGEVRGATWAEVDLAGALWTIPEGRMKAGKEHRVPLSPRAVEILKSLPRIAGNPHLFPAPQGGALSDMTISAVMRRMEVDAVPHGFRSTFRDWCSERTSYPREVSEMALAHTIDSKVEAAYRRGDLFTKRVKMMNEWARFIEAKPATGKNVVPIKGRG
jgi:integrase